MELGLAGFYLSIKWFLECCVQQGLSQSWFCGQEKSKTVYFGVNWKRCICKIHAQRGHIERGSTVYVFNLKIQGVPFWMKMAVFILQTFPTEVAFIEMVTEGNIRSKLKSWKPWLQFSGFFGINVLLDTLKIGDCKDIYFHYWNLITELFLIKIKSVTKSRTEIIGEPVHFVSYFSV